MKAWFESSIFLLCELDLTLNCILLTSFLALEARQVTFYIVNAGTLHQKLRIDGGKTSRF